MSAGPDPAHGHIMRQIANVIYNRRIEKQLSQEELAEQIGSSQTQISRWECGHHVPGTAAIAELSSVLDLDLERLIRDAMTIAS